MIIAVDGPAASGKGTLARKLAVHYDLAYLDTGSLYRAVALKLLQAGDDPRDEGAAMKAAQTLDIADIDDHAIRAPDVGNAASIVASMAPVRAAMVDVQRNFAQSPPGQVKGAVLDGRDIGTVICPFADVKLFVDASLEVRAHRRFLELKDRDPETSITEAQLLEDLKERDTRDRSRATAPLLAAEDAHLIDTTNFSIEAAFQAACAIIDRARQSPTD